MARQFVTVALDPKPGGTPGKPLYVLTINPITVWCDPFVPDEVVWRGKHCDVKMEFKKNGTPFAQDTMSGPNNVDVPSGNPVNNLKKKYQYKLTVTANPAIPTGSSGFLQPIVIDPEVIIDSGGPPSDGTARKPKKPKVPHRKPSAPKARTRAGRKAKK